MAKYNDKIHVESRNIAGMREEHDWDSVPLISPKFCTPALFPWPHSFIVHWRSCPEGGQPSETPVLESTGPAGKGLQYEFKQRLHWGSSG